MRLVLLGETRLAIVTYAAELKMFYQQPAVCAPYGMRTRRVIWPLLSQ